MTGQAAGWRPPGGGSRGRGRWGDVEHRRVSHVEAPTERLPATQRDVGAGAPASGDGGRPLVLGRYRLCERLGSGAFGTVWRARDERLERDVAVKAIAGEHVASGRAAQEARAAARLAHPAIVTLYEAGADEEATYLVSELVHGATLAELLAAGALSDRDVAGIGLALCGALAHAHVQGVVHRDVKPSNVLVPDAVHDGAPAAKLTDFGVARVVGAGGDALTRTGDVVGTLAYMAPEQAEGREAGPAADLYAAALVLYESLAGVNPIRGGSAVATARRLGATLPPLARQRRDLPPALCAAIDRALLPRPGERGSVASLHRALAAARAELLDEPGTVLPPRLERAATAVTQVAERGRSLRLAPRRRRRQRELADVAAELGALEEGFERPARPHRPRAPLLAGHVLPGLAAGGLVALALATLAPPDATAATTPSPVPTGALAAAVVGLLPRLGWVVSAAVLLGWLAGEAALPGAALLIACGLAPLPLLLPLRGRAWSVPFAAPLLGVALLAGAYPALAGQARTLWRRAALGALGFWVLALAEPLVDRTLYYGAARGTAPAGTWEGSLHDAAGHVLAPLLESGALLGAALWAAAAAILPWLVRGRSAALDLVAATVWAGALATAAGALGGALGGAVPHPDPRGAALGGAAAVLLAVAACALRGGRRAAPVVA